MTVSSEIEAEIRRQYFAEHWPVGTVARQLGQHADVVRRVLKLDEPRLSTTKRVLLVGNRSAIHIYRPTRETAIVPIKEARPWRGAVGSSGMRSRPSMS